MNKKPSIWKKIKEFMSLKKESQQFKELKKTAHQINPQKVRKLTFISNLCLLFIIFIMIIGVDIIERNMDFFSYQRVCLLTIISLFAVCAFSLLIVAEYILFNKIIEINNQEIKHIKENVEY